MGLVKVCTMARREQFIAQVGIRDSDLPSRRKINLFTSSISLSVRPRKTITILLMILSLNPLKPTGYVMHHQFNIQQFHYAHAVFMCFVFI